MLAFKFIFFKEICKMLFDLSDEYIFKILNFYNFILYIIKDINGQSAILTFVQWLDTMNILKRIEYIFFLYHFF